MLKVLAHKYIDDWIDATVKVSQGVNYIMYYKKMKVRAFKHGKCQWPNVIWKPADEETQYNSGDDPVGPLRSLRSLTFSKFEENTKITDRDDKKGDHKHYN